MPKLQKTESKLLKTTSTTVTIALLYTLVTKPEKASRADLVYIYILPSYVGPKYKLPKD